MGIPTVQILIGGHLSDLARVAKSVACQTPVVICQGKSCPGLVSTHKSAGHTIPYKILLAIKINLEFLSYKSTHKKTCHTTPYTHVDQKNLSDNFLYGKVLTDLYKSIPTENCK